MKITSTPTQNKFETSEKTLKGFILYNVPIEYKKEEIQELLFEPVEIPKIKHMRLFKTRLPKSQLKTLKVSVHMDGETSLAEDMIARFQNLALDEDHILKVKGVFEEDSMVGSRSIEKIEKRGKGSTEVKPRDVVGANVTRNVKRDESEKNVKKIYMIPKQNSKDTLFVRNLNYKFMDKDQLARIFHVKREDVHIPARRCYDCFLEGYFRHPYLNCGFAIIKLEDCEDIEKKAQEFNDTIFEGRRLVVEVAHVKPRYH